MALQYSVLDSIEPIAPEWDDLAARTRADPFARPGWFRTWWNAFGRGRLEIGVLRDDGRLSGVAPLHRHWATLLSAANVHSPHYAFIAEGPAAMRELVARTFERSPRHTSLCFLDGDADSTAEVERGARLAGRRLLTVTMQRSPYVAMRGTWDEFESELSSKFVRDLRRRRRQLDAEGTVAIEVADGSERLPDLLAEAFRLEPSGWKEKRGTAIVSNPRTRRFYGDLAEWAAAEGMLRLAFLR